MLSRINLGAVLKKLGYSYIKEFEMEIFDTDIITEDDYLSFRNTPTKENRLF